MNILITGSTGLLGRELVSELSKNHHVYPMTRNYICKEWGENSHISPIIMDLSNIDERKLPNQVDAIYYLAQGRNFRDFPGAALETVTINTIAPLHLASWGLSHGVTSFYYASTGGVYAPSNDPIDEMSTITCSGLYPSSKYSAELLLQNFQSLYKSFAILRPFFIYGPLQEQNMLIPRLINSVNNHSSVFVSGKDGFRMNPIFVSDAVSACIGLLDTEGFNIFNVAGPEVVTFGELIRIIGRALGKDPVIEKNDGVVNHLVADISKIKEMSAPVVSVENGVSLTIKGMGINE